MNAFLWMIAISATPFIELRGAIPFGLAAGLSPVLVILSCTIANLLVAPVVLGILHFTFTELEKIPKIGGWIKRQMDRIHRDAGKYVDKYGPVGLALFVAVPLPGTGAWSGCIAAYLLSMKKKRAMIAIALGVVGAGIIVSLASLGIWKFFGMLA